MAIYAGHASIDAYTMDRSDGQLEMTVSIGFQTLATHGGFCEFRKCECLGSAINGRSRLQQTSHSDVGYHSDSCLFSFLHLRRAVGQNKQILFGWRHTNSDVIIAFSDLFAGKTGG